MSRTPLTARSAARRTPPGRGRPPPAVRGAGPTATTRRSRSTSGCAGAEHCGAARGSGRRQRRRSCRAGAGRCARCGAVGPACEVVRQPEHLPRVRDDRLRPQVGRAAGVASRSNSATPTRRSSSASPCDRADGLTPTRSAASAQVGCLGDRDEVLELANRQVGEVAHLPTILQDFLHNRYC